MPSKSTKVPRSKSNSEDSDWYATPEGRRRTRREFTRALREGILTPSTGLNVRRTDPKVLERLMEQAKESATRAISIRIPISDIERAKRLAENIGVGYQTVLKQAIRDGLKRAG